MLNFIVSKCEEVLGKDNFAVVRNDNGILMLNFGEGCANFQLFESSKYWRDFKETDKPCLVVRNIFLPEEYRGGGLLTSIVSETTGRGINIRLETVQNRRLEQWCLHNGFRKATLEKYDFDIAPNMIRGE